MKLIPNAGRVWHRLWSVRIPFIFAAITAADSYWSVTSSFVDPRLYAAGGFLLSIAARLVQQEDIRRGS